MNLINQPSSGTGPAGGGVIPAQSQPGEQIIQVSPEDKEAIDRVSYLI